MNICLSVTFGALAHPGEHPPCRRGAVGSSPTGSTSFETERRSLSQCSGSPVQIRQFGLRAGLSSVVEQQPKRECPVTCLEFPRPGGGLSCVPSGEVRSGSVGILASSGCGPRPRGLVHSTFGVLAHLEERPPCKREAVGSSPTGSTILNGLCPFGLLWKRHGCPFAGFGRCRWRGVRGCSSVVELRLPKPTVVGSSPIARSTSTSSRPSPARCGSGYPTSLRSRGLLTEQSFGRG